ncbi:FecR domain-containing protein [Paraflavitalea speifideaquila]|uniref:FecR family protein n=1 Tax=Paraflavitalea speifideaquila TaxID=3076558 RepID=UPI0028E3B9B2|nr:FecR domain-containing protein [Paraflavitalea speifideiaquila]
MSVTVLGTKFNVNAYDDEPEIKVTLLEGSVRVTLRQAQGDKEAGGIKSEVLLKPGEQAGVKVSTNVGGREGASPLTIHHSPDIEQVMAWKNGYFHFNRDDLETVMRQIARWYDVEIVYEGKIPQRFLAAKSIATPQLRKY